MSPFHSILATLLALLIASPLCCCSAKAADAPARPSCCAEKVESDGEKNPDKTPHACDCKAKAPRDEVKNIELPANVALPFVPVVQDLSWLVPPVIERLPMAATPHTGCDPPRLLLARYSRWLL